MRQQPKKSCLGHHSLGREFSQKEINDQMIQAARQGKTVVRLKGGDPVVFGCSVEETAALTSAGIPYEIVPGVTAALAVAGYAEIPITHGNQASAVALVTGHQRSDKAEPLDYAALADFPGTLVFYMGIRNAECWSTALLQRGKSPDTPVAIVRRCTFADQKIVRCTLGTVVKVIAEEKLRPPAIVVIGEVVDLAPLTSWFAKRPLTGQTVMVTRPQVETGRCAQDDVLIQQLRELGANVLNQPVIRISDPPDWQPVDAMLRSVESIRLDGIFQRQWRAIFSGAIVIQRRRSATTIQYKTGGNRSGHGRRTFAISSPRRRDSVGVSRRIAGRIADRRSVGQAFLIGSRESRA